MRLTVELVLDSPLAMILLWGRDLVQIYNDGYRDIMGAKHPDGLGQPTRACWPEVWSFNAPVYDAVSRGEGRSFKAQKLTIDRHGIPEDAWFDLTYMPVRDDTGVIAGVIVTVVEVTDEVLERRHQRFRVELEEQLRPLRDAREAMATASGAVGRQLDADLVAYADVDAVSGVATIEQDWSRDGATSVAGRRRLQEFGPGLIDELAAGRTVVVCDMLTDRRTATPASRLAFDGLQVRALLSVPLIKDGRMISVLSILAGGPRSWVAADVRLAEETAERTWAAVERARAEAALRESEALLDAIFESAPVGLGVWDTDLRFVRVNSRLAEMNGISPQGHVGHRPTELLPELKGLDGLMDSWRRVLATGRPLVGVEVSGTTPASPGSVGHWSEHFFPIRVGSAIVGLGGVIEDISARKMAERQRALLVDELNHRVKNTLAIVQAISRQTFRRSEVPRTVREAFDGRLAALAAAHDLLTSSHWESANLQDLAREAVALCGIPEARTGIAGPPVVLDPREAVSLALALHELCTNAMKYGSMSVDGGGVDLHWGVIGGADPRLELVWREFGGPEVAEPTRAGFGTRMLAQALAQELRGDVSLEFRPEGLRCTITAPRRSGDGMA